MTSIQSEKMKILTPKQSAEYIVSKSTHVTVKNEGVKCLAQKIYDELAGGKNMQISSSREHGTFPPNLTQNESINWIFLLDTLNFCFWTKLGEEKYIVELNGKHHTGYFALCASLYKALMGGYKLLDPKFYKTLTLDDLKKIFVSSTGKEIPLIAERLNCLHEVGEVLEKKYGGSFVNCVKEANLSAQKLLDLVTTDFPCFQDTASYHGKTVTFYKRAQILIGDLWCLNYGQGIAGFKDIDSLSMFADYRVPQVLVAFGALSYSDHIMELLKNDVTLANGSVEEVEIRGCSVEVVERINKLIHEWMKQNDDHYKCNAILIDYYLWSYRREQAAQLESIPFHKVHSIYY